MHPVDIETDGADAAHAPTYAGRLFDQPVPKLRLPEEGMEPRAAYQLVHDELNLDGNPALNLASFVTSWMEPEADQLALENLNKNLIDGDEYPQTEVIHRRVVNMVAGLFNAPDDCHPVGTATIGSSEAIMLGLLAHKRAWRHRQEHASRPTDRPNVIMGADVHTCWEKFADYFDVESRVAPMRPGRYTLTPEDVEARADENTIAVAGLAGTTFTGQLDDLKGIDELLQKLEKDRGWRIPMHIDGASGGFVLPFTQPKLAWDFRLESVRSINVSNHKFGLVYPGMGTVIFRDRSDVPDDLVFHINYLGGDMPNYSLNFSRPSTSVLLQYFMFLRLGRAGYEQVMNRVMDTARSLHEQLVALEDLEPVQDDLPLPVLALQAKDPQRVDVFALSEKLRGRGWIVPAYTLPPDAQEVAVLRIVVRESFSRDMADQLVGDVADALGELTGQKREPAERRGEATQARQPIC